MGVVEGIVEDETGPAIWSVAVRRVVGIQVGVGMDIVASSDGVFRASGTVGVMPAEGGSGDVVGIQLKGTHAVNGAFYRDGEDPVGFGNQGV